MDAEADSAGRGAASDAVEALVLDFFMNLDTGAFEALADCMAPGGEWHRQGKILRGREMILSAMAERGRDVRTAHLVANFRLVSAGRDAAQARFFLVAYRFDGPVRGGEPSPMDLPVSIGLYRCECTRDREGLAHRGPAVAALVQAFQLEHDPEELQTFRDHAERR